MANPRTSTDEETAPLLDDDRRNGDSFFSALFHPARPLNNVEKILAGLAILFLLLMSTFIGLFAGAEGALKRERGKEVGWQTTTEVVTATATTTQGGTVTATTTVAGIPTEKPERAVCLTPECVLLSASILQSLNTSMDPCDDFYKYAVGGWEATHSIPADRGNYGAFNEVADNNKKVILRVLNSIPSTSLASSAEERNLHKLKSVYTSCMAIDELNEVGLKPLSLMTDFILDTFGPFDLVPAPGDDLVDAADAWRGAWTEEYEVTEELLAAAAKAEACKTAKKTGRSPKHDAAPEIEQQIADETMTQKKVDSNRKERLTKTIAWLHSRGVQALVNFAIEGDAGGEDSQIQSLWLYQAFGGLPSKEYYEEKPILDLYQSVVQGVLIDIASHSHVKREKRDWLDEVIEEFEDIEDQGWPWPWPGDDDKPGKKDPPPRKPTKEEPIEKRMERLAGKVVAFERELMRAGADPEYLFNPHFAYNPYPTKRVEKALPFLDIPAYISTFAPRTFPLNITVTHPPYLKSVSHLVDSTPDYVLSAYFNARLAMTYASALGPKVGVRAEVRKLTEVLSGIKKGTEEIRQDVCLGWVDNLVGLIAGREFVREAFSPEAKDEGEDIIRTIVRVFHDKLPHIAWMDQTSAKAAQAKADAIIPKVGYPLYPNTTDPDSLERYYARVDIKSDDFFGNILRSTLFEETINWSGLGRPRNRQSWGMNPQEVNAYYSPPDGEIVFPAGILQPPFYSHSWPAHLKYGAFGAVAAHELTHAFDNSGSQYDEKGRLRDWWTNGTVRAFQERAQCVARQYSKYYVLDSEGRKVYVNGNLTNGENIADSGLAQSYSAWQSSVSSSAKSLRLPGLDFSDDQLFFLAFARMWARLFRPEALVARVRTDPHSPSYWRATGTLQNLAAFHEAFKCKEGSRMNPPKKDQCELW